MKGLDLMGVIFSVAVFCGLILLAIIGASVESLHYFFAVIIPYFALAVFIFGLIYRLLSWARSPVPFRITTTCGQQKSLDFIKQNKIDNPSTALGTFMRMALEVLAFRSLFRNTKAGLKEGPLYTYGASKWLWLFSIMFHYSFLVIILRHFRFFVEPVPSFVNLIQQFDGFLQVGLPIIYMTSVAIVIGAGFLLFRRFYDSKVKYISLPSDYFPLFLILGIALSGIWMRHIAKVDLIAMKELAVGILSFRPIVPANLDMMFLIHLFLVSSLLIYFPMSKLVHMPGIFLSPTRNLANNNRMERHVNPWINDLKLHTHSYAEYEDEFRGVMIDSGLPVDKEVADVK